MMTCLVEIFHVESIIPDLVNRRLVVSRAPYFELQYENRGVKNDDCVDAAAQSRNIELQQKVPT